MAASILSQDIIGISLILVNGDVNATLRQVICAVEQFQKEHDRHFGISTYDFRSLLLTLVFIEMGMEKDFSDESWLTDITCLEIIPAVLKYHDAYFNDEGEHLMDVPGVEDVMYHYGYSAEEYIQKCTIKKSMQVFFIDNSIMNDQSKVKDFMTTHGLDRSVLFHCSRPGESS